MKRKFLKQLMIGIMLSIFSLAAYSTVDASGITAFSDVPEGHWAYQTIMDMTQAGLFAGTTEPVNGVGTFSPDNTMKRAEFITVAVRAMYPAEASQSEQTAGNDEYWWQKYYRLALDKGIVTKEELGFGNLELPISREEMAMIMVRCVEKNGEILTKRVNKSQIADYSTVGKEYQNYVLDAYSFGLLCGIDDKGTFAPVKTLTRAEAAAVLCRLLDKEMRVKVEFDEQSSGGSGGSGGTSSPGGDRPGNSEIEPPTSLPWENGGKQPAEYTWAEFEALTPGQQIAFQNHLGASAFENWLNQAQSGVGQNPWEQAGAKQPEDYTWEEFEALPPGQQIAFQNYLGAVGFESWMNEAQGMTEQNPWDKAGAKQPEDYTWEEFEALPPGQQIAFQNYLGAVGFESWMNQVQSGAGQNPWDKAGAKQPRDYTWEEFEALTPGQQIAFQNYLGASGFESWMNEAQGMTEQNPWDKAGAKQPRDYTWEEFEALTGAQQIAFQNYLGESGFENWLTANQP